MQNVKTNTQEQCKDNKKQTAKHEIIKNPKIILKKLIQMIIEKCVNIPI